MNTRRGFLTSLLKLGVGAAVAPTILPAATTYARRWVKQRGLYIAGYDVSGDYVTVYHYMMQPLTFLPSFQDFDAWIKLRKDIKWEPNMGDTMRGLKC